MRLLLYSLKETKDYLEKEKIFYPKDDKFFEVLKPEIYLEKIWEKDLV